MDQRQKVAILRVLRDAGGAMGSSGISKGIEAYGYDTSPRTIRSYLEDLELRGLVSASRRGRGGGRAITPAGISEIDDALLLERVGLAAVRVDTLAWQTSFDPARRQGRVVLNTSIIDRRALPRAMREMAAVFARGYSMGEHMTLFSSGEAVEGARIGSGRIGIGTVCSVTLNGVLLGARVPIKSRFAGVLELRDGVPTRFTDAVHYDGTSLDPLEVFVKVGLLSVRQATRTGTGRIGASFREVPTCALDTVLRVADQMRDCGMDAVLAVGKPGQPLLGVPVPEGRTGLIVAGGLNPLAAVEEAGVETVNYTLCRTAEFSLLHRYDDLAREMEISL